MNKKFSILYVDDEVSNLNVFKNTFRRSYNIYTAESAKEGLEILDRETIDLVLTDQRMPEMSGVEFLKEVLKKYPEPSRILVTAFTDFNALKDAVNEAKIFQYIQKPWDEKEIHLIIERAFEIHYLRQENYQLTRMLQESNEQLMKLNNELIELDKLKFQFLNIISHEIRTPLNGLMGATTLFKHTLNSDDYIKYHQLFQILETSTERLSHFLLLAERITAFKAEKYRVNPELFFMNELVNKVAGLLKNKLDNKGLKLEIEFCDGETGDCYAEQRLIEICLIEILDNAIKHSPANGAIKIKICTNNNKIYIDIVDMGPGFPKIVLNNIFKPFITDNNISKQGMGLDLVLIHLIIEAHNGIINISNNKDKGATVQLIFDKQNVKEASSYKA
ncbi:MAG TPA: hybrid sensor histidine kinase/response regulator [Bacteroidales bacterium]|nr:hybrid sensor histidine kinase/response regulator [Bacteroidales bacterium]